jgi:hypothetical protein
MDMQEAYVRSVVAIPAMLQAMTEMLNEIAGSLDVLAIYCEKKGVAEGILSNEDLDGGEDEPGKAA